MANCVTRADLAGLSQESLSRAGTRARIFTPRVVGVEGVADLSPRVMRGASCGSERPFRPDAEEGLGRTITGSLQGRAACV